MPRSFEVFCSADRSGTAKNPAECRSLELLVVYIQTALEAINEVS